MYAVEFRFGVVDGRVPPSLDFALTSVYRVGRRPMARVRHARTRWVGGSLFVVAFVMAAGVDDVRHWAGEVGPRLAAEMSLTQVGEFRVWTARRLGPREAWP